MTHKSRIYLEGLQIKSLEKAKLLAEALDTIEIECGIGSVGIQIEDMYVCTDIDFSEFNTTPMEALLKEMLRL